MSKERHGLTVTIPPHHSQQRPDELPHSMEKGAENQAKHPGPPPGGPPGPPGGWLCQRMSRSQEILFNIMVAFLQLIPQSTLTTVFPVSGDIAKSFEITNTSVLPWLVAAYASSFGTFILVGGRLGDIFGHKTMVLIGYSFLGFWSVIVGLSHYAGYEVLFIARAFQGIGSSLMVPNGLALLGRTYPPGSKQKVFSFTIFGLCAPVGAYLGMIFGALFTKFATWHWSFYTLAIVCGLLAICAQLVLISPPPTPKQMRPVKEKLRDMDWLGALTGVGGLICVQVSLVSAPAAGWSTQYIFMLLVIGVLLIAFFIITELKIAEQPLVPFRMLKAEVGFVLGAVACGWATFGIWTWFLWKYLLNIKHDSPLGAAVRVVPIVPVALVASILTAWMMRKCRPSWTLFWALVAFTLGPLLLAIDADLDRTSYWSWTFCSLLIMPLGMDMSMPAATFIMSNFFPPQQQGIAGSLISTTINYSISLGLGLAATVEVHVNNHGHDPMAGIRGGWFMGVGLGGLGVLICVAFVVRSVFYPTPQLPKGPPGPPPTAGGPPPMHMTPQTSPTRGTRTDTVSSFATTMVAESVGALSPKNLDIEAFKSFNFDTPTVRSPKTPAQTSPGMTTDTHQSSPSWPGHGSYPVRSSSKPKNTPKKNAHQHSDSTTPLRSRANSQTHLAGHPAQTPTSPLPHTIPLPTELETAYRGRGSWESEDDVPDREEFWPPKSQVPSPSRQFHAHAQSFPSHGKDVDGFDMNNRPAMPRTMMGDESRRTTLCGLDQYIADRGIPI
nr:multidrug-resistance type transporter aminotriazole resistance [Exophiala xenobiotica]